MKRYDKNVASRLTVDLRGGCDKKKSHEIYTKQYKVYRVMTTLVRRKPE